MPEPNPPAHRWRYERSDAGVLVRCECGVRAAWVRCPAVAHRRAEDALHALFGDVPDAGHGPARVSPATAADAAARPAAMVRAA